MSDQTWRVTLTNFLVGGLSGMTATAVIQPLDMVKVRIQLGSEAKGSVSPFEIARKMYAEEGGISSFYKGLDAALLRQAVYATLRLGLYFNFSDALKKKSGKENLTPSEKAIASLSSGALGSFIATPCDLALVRFQSDATLPEAQRRNYKNVFDAFSRIIKEEGFKSMYTGGAPTVYRAMAMNLCMMATYDQAKEMITPYLGKGKPMLIASSFVAGSVAAVGSLPFDNVKTKLQKQKRGADGQFPYKNFMECLRKSIQNEGFNRLWAGLPTFYFRVGIHAMVTLLSSEVYKHYLMPK